MEQATLDFGIVSLILTLGRGNLVSSPGRVPSLDELSKRFNPLTLPNLHCMGKLARKILLMATKTLH